MCRLLVLLCFILFAFSHTNAQSTTIKYVILGQDFLYTCPLEAPISWHVHGNELTGNSSEHTIYPNGSLLISPVTMKLTGLNVANRCCRDSGSVCASFVFLLSIINPPTAENMTVLEFTDVTLDCNSQDSQPAPGFSWYRSGVKVSSNREYQLINVSRDDSGTYTCTVTNSVGSRSTDMQLSVEYEPSTFAADSSIRYASPGDVLNLQCVYSGEPDPVVTWYFGRDDDLTAASEILDGNVVVDSANSITLVLASVRRNNTGFYFCSANNTRGISHTRFQVVVVTVPQAPMVSVIGTTSRTISIKWTYRDNGNSPITHTFVEYTANNSTSQNTLIDGNLTTGFTLTQLTANTGFLIKVSVMNAKGASLPGSVYTATSPLPPPEPAGVTFRVLSQEVLELYWESPLLTFEHTAITRYEYQIRLMDGGAWGALDIAYVAGGIEFQGLSPGTRYEARVRAINSAGASPFVTLRNMTMYTFPGQPQLSADVLDFQTIRVSWSPSTTGGAPLLRWIIEILRPSSAWTLIATLDITQTVYDVNELQPNTTYLIRISVANRIGNSPYNVAMVTTQIKGAIAAVSDATAEIVTHKSITLSWSPVIYEDIIDVLKYEIKYSLLADSIQPTHQYITEKTSYTFQELQPLSTYRFSIIARDGNDVSVRPLVLSYTTTLPPILIEKSPFVPVLGKNFKLSCVFSELYQNSSSPSYVSWYKEGVDFRENSQDALQSPQDFYQYKNQLVFPTWKSAHYGNYSCRVRDMFTYEYIAEADTSVIDFFKEHMEVFIIAAAILACFLAFLCLLVFVLCSICCFRRRQKARDAHNFVGIPKRSWLKNTPLYSPIRGDTSGFNPLRTEVDTHREPRESVVEPDRLLEPEVAASYPQGEHIYTTSFMHSANNNGTPSGTLERPNFARMVVMPANLDGTSSHSSKVDSDVQAPAPPPPFSSHDVFGDTVSLPKRLTITEGLNSFRYEREGFGSPPSSVATAPNFDNVSNDSAPRPLYQNLQMENEPQHVQGVEMINLPTNCISTDI